MGRKVDEGADKEGVDLGEGIILLVEDFDIEMDVFQRLIELVQIIKEFVTGGGDVRVERLDFERGWGMMAEKS